jgi:hypothetical protein
MGGYCKMSTNTIADPDNKLQTDADYIVLKRYDYSLTKLLERYPQGCPDHIIADGLGLTESQLDILYQQIVISLQDYIGVS